MALTPEDVVNKRFQPTKFREGYDQDEVDDFLDEVLVELRRLNQENDDLKQRLAAAEAQGGSGSISPVSASLDAEVQRLRTENEQLKRSLDEAQKHAETASEAPAIAPAPVPVHETVDEAEETTDLLQLARRLHDEHVNEGIEKREALISEARVTAARIVADAEGKQRAILQESAAAERRIEELRTFERDYRSGLKSYLESQLRELNGRTPVVAATPVESSNQSVPSPVPATSRDSAAGNSGSNPVFPGLGA